MTEISLRYLRNRNRDPQKYGKLILEPFAPGSGLPCANALRRVLLSSVPGKGVVAVRFDNIVHEFSTIPGVRDDVFDVIKNLKKIVWKGEWEQDIKTARLEVSGPCEVTAADVSLPFGLEIVNTDQPITTVAAGQRLGIEIDVMSGRGWCSSEDNKNSNAPITTIFIDTNFNPVKHVQYHIQPVLWDNKKAERVIIEVQTNGSIAPDIATCVATRFLKAHIRLLEDFEVGSQAEAISEDAGKSRVDLIKEEDVAVLCLSNRSKNCLKFTDIKTIGDLASKTVNDLIEIKNFGRKSLNEIREKLAEHGLYLRDDEGWDGAAADDAGDEDYEDADLSPDEEGDAVG